MQTRIVLTAPVLVAIVAVQPAWAEEPATTVPAPAAQESSATQGSTEVTVEQSEAEAAPAARSRPAPRKLPEPEGARRLSADYDVWLDAKRGVVIVDGIICLREGMLEMFACTKNSKEHESIVSVNSKAYLVHAGLLALGAVPGNPVRFVPDYKPPSGTEIDVLIQYTDEDGNEATVRAQDWIKDIRTGKSMTYPFVFGGSTFWTDPETGKKYYQAERGDFICVSNFGTAMLDIPVASSAENEQLAFQTFSDRIPPLWTPVRVLLRPKLKKQGARGSEQKAETVTQPEKKAER